MTIWEFLNNHYLIGPFLVIVVTALFASTAVGVAEALASRPIEPQDDSDDEE